MSRKDYELIAAAVNETREGWDDGRDQNIIDDVASHVGAALAAQHKGYPWKWFRWNQATGVNRPPQEQEQGVL